MKRRFLVYANKRIPRKWWYVLGAGLIIYFIYISSVFVAQSLGLDETELRQRSVNKLPSDSEQNMGVNRENIQVGETDAKNHPQAKKLGVFIEKNNILDENIIWDDNGNNGDDIDKKDENQNKGGENEENNEDENENNGDVNEKNNGDDNERNKGDDNENNNGDDNENNNGDDNEKNKGDNNERNDGDENKRNNEYDNENNGDEIILPDRGEGDLQDQNENEAAIPVPEPEPEVKIPHLFFHDEGIGQVGTAVKIDKESLNPADRMLYEQGYKRNDFNEYVSNLISVDRAVPETRDPQCLTQTYADDLPDTSVIICFLNEAWSVLVRTVHSVINTSPPHLLREIILVDDHSDYEHLHTPLEVYMKRFPKVRIIRNSQREGLIRSRLKGAAVATGQVLTFLDSHIECATGWLLPLLSRIQEDPTHVVWPWIPSIDGDTFQFAISKSARNLEYGAFSWQMNYRWEFANPEDRETLISPIRSPTMAGGLFSIDRKYFYHIGSYDEGMEFWGAENLEMSFRIWMCGGTIEIMPCSIVGHIFRKRNVNANRSNRNMVAYNALRTVMVWLDDYKYLYRKVSGTKLEDYGDISRRLELREKLNCKDFDWYLTHVYKHAFLPTEAKMAGLIYSVEEPSKCLEASDRSDSRVTVNNCNKRHFRSQMFFMTKDEEVRLIGSCLDGGKKTMVMWGCHKNKGTQQLLYRSKDNTFYNPVRRKCLQWMENSFDLELRRCDGNPLQQWMWEPMSVDFLMGPDQSDH